MSIVNTLALESNRQIKISFDGGDLSSDAGIQLPVEIVIENGKVFLSETDHPVCHTFIIFIFLLTKAAFSLLQYKLICQYNLFLHL